MMKHFSMYFFYIDIQRFIGVDKFIHKFSYHIFSAIHDLVTVRRFLNGFTSKMEGVFTQMFISVETDNKTPCGDK